jgi:4-amino-4-deoxy-L-arabinose transferase-like glycosyltransferase
VVALDTLIAVLAGLGLGRLWRRYRVFALWLAIGFGFLLIWPTKWPQYILTITVPVCLAAAEGFQGRVWEPLMRWLGRHRCRTAPGRTLRRNASPAARPVTPCRG